MSSQTTAPRSIPVAPPLEQHLAALRESIVNRPPYCQGTISLPTDAFTLFYGKDTSARRINLAHASPDELQHLAETCDPATFGLGQKDVYDETYRKAGKLDASDFALKFSPEALGLLDTVHAELLVEGGKKATDSIRAELYKLNVYGPQSFFKAHVDTPRSELMFGSLVLVFPTPHSGGALVLREHTEEKTQEWTFDSAALLAKASAPSVAYVAFFSDVEHEVMPVQSGHRVTITYNLYHVQDAPAATLPAAHPIAPHEAPFRDALERLLRDPTFLPEGGNLMFPLRHQYPLSTFKKSEEEARQALRSVAARLKASDALVLATARALRLDAAPRIVYEDRSKYSGVQYVMCDRVVPLEDVQPWVERPLHEWLMRKEGGVVLNPDKQLEGWLEGEADKVAWVHWVGAGVGAGDAGWRVNAVKTTYLAYGNDADVEHTYWKVSLLVRVGPAGRRATAA